MKLKNFKKLDKKKQTIIIMGISILLLITAFLIYRTYAIYIEKENFSMMKGSVPDQNYDLKFSFLLEDEGESTFLNEIPKDKKYLVSISCNHDAVGKWDYDSWGPLITNLNQTQTKCNITFSTSYPLETYGIHERLTRTETGLYEVSHEDAEITYTDDVSVQNVLKQKEYRYAGSNPDNYVWFNEELWRIIGLVNTPEGQRIKIIRSESIGNFSWDSSASSINSGLGVNEWSQSKLMNLLNTWSYYYRSTGSAYIGPNEQKAGQNFTNTGLMNESKEMIDTITWNTGSNDGIVYSHDNMKTKDFYNQERSNHTSKACNNDTYCNDNVSRTTTWKGQVGLMYPSDYGYATSGGSSGNREICLNRVLYNWVMQDDEDFCAKNDWLYNSNDSSWTLTPHVDTRDGNGVFFVSASGGVGLHPASDNHLVLPSVYLKSDLIFTGGNGTKENPYLLG